MFSSSISLSPAPFLSTKYPLNATTPPSTSVTFRPPRRISAAYATSERTTRTTPTSRISTPASLYDVLGVHTGATCHEIKTAYRRLARISHPDVRSNGGKDASSDEFIRIHAAYSTLSNPEKRAIYDRKILRRPSFSMSAGFTGRTWETDQCW